MPKETKLYDILNVAPSAGESEIRKVRTKIHWYPFLALFSLSPISNTQKYIIIKRI